MPNMRALLVADPSIPVEVRTAISRGDGDARSGLMHLGLNECEAAELLDEQLEDGWTCG